MHKIWLILTSCSRALSFVQTSFVNYIGKKLREGFKKDNVHNEFNFFRSNIYHDNQGMYDVQPHMHHICHHLHHNGNGIFHFQHHKSYPNPLIHLICQHLECCNYILEEEEKKIINHNFKIHFLGSLFKK